MKGEALQFAELEVSFVRFWRMFQREQYFLSFSGNPVATSGPF